MSIRLAVVTVALAFVPHVVNATCATIFRNHPQGREIEDQIRLNMVAASSATSCKQQSLAGDIKAKTASLVQRYAGQDRVAECMEDFERRMGSIMRREEGETQFCDNVAKRAKVRMKQTDDLLQ